MAQTNPFAIEEVQADNPFAVEEVTKSTANKPKQDTFARNLGAGLTTDFVGGLTALPGYIGAGIEGLGNYATGDKDFLDSFTGTLDEGADRSLVETGTEIRQAGRDFLNVPMHPTTTEGQAGELLGMIGVPVPGAALRAVFGGGTKLAHAAALMSPVMRIEGVTGRGAKEFVKSALRRPNIAGNALRVGAQTAIGAGAQQGIRAVIDEPLMFSDKALGTHNPFAVEEVPLDNPFTVEQDNNAVAIDREMQAAEEDRNSSIVNWSIAGGILITAATIASRRSLLARIGPSMEAPLGKNLQAPVDKTFTAKGLFVDKHQHVRNLLQKAETVDPATGQRSFTHTAEEVDRMSAEYAKDPILMTQDILKYGDFGDVNVSNMPSLEKFALKYLEMEKADPATRKILVEGILAASEQVRRPRATLSSEINDIKAANPNDPSLMGTRTGHFMEGNGLERLLKQGTPEQIDAQLARMGIRPDDARYVKPGLIDDTVPDPITGLGTPWSASRIQNAIDLMHNTPTANIMAKEYSQMVEGVLEFAQKSKLIGNMERKLWRRHFDAYGRNVYMPGVNVIESNKNFNATLAKVFGENSDEGRLANQMANMRSSIATDNKGLTHPLDIVQSFAQYTHAVVNHAHTNNMQWNFLSKYLGLDQDMLSFGQYGKAGKIENSFGIEFAGIRSDLADIAADGSPTSYVSSMKRTIPKDANGNITASKNLQDKFNWHEKVSKLPPEHDILTIQRYGKEAVFYIPDPIVREAIRNGHKTLGIINKIARYTKNMFQFGTTRLPTFLPKSWGYATQNVWQNSVAKGFNYTPWDAFKGTWELVSTSLADEMASHMARSLARDSGFFSKLPRNVVDAWQQTLSAKVKRSLLRGMQQQGGGNTASMAASEVMPNIKDIMADVVPNLYKNDWLGTRQFFRYYDRLARAVQEGPTYAAKAKYIRNGKPTNISAADHNASAHLFGVQLGGNVRDVGSSQLATNFQSWVPFSGAMIQSWNSIGMGLKAAYKKGNYFRMAGSVSLPMIPAISEALLFSFLGKEFLDWYWNDANTHNRTTNWLIPAGERPEDSIAIAMSPEWALSKGISVEFIDSILQLSTKMPYDKTIGGGGESAGLDENGWNAIAGFVTFTDIPVPPLVKASFALNGYNLRIGPQPSDEGGIGSWFGGITPLGTGEKLSANKGSSKYVDPVAETEAAAVIQALGGSLGKLFMDIAQAFVIGTTDDSSGSKLLSGLDRAADQAKDSIGSMAKYTNGLWDRSLLKRNSNDELADTARVKTNGIKSLANMLKIAKSPGINSDGTRLPGNAQRMVDDPAINIAMLHVGKWKPSIDHHQSKINNLRSQNDSLRSSSRAIPGGPSLSLDEVNQQIEDNHARIRSWNAKIILASRSMEDGINEAILKQLGREGNFTLNNVTPRSSLSRGTGLAGVISAPTN